MIRKIFWVGRSEWGVWDIIWGGWELGRKHFGWMEVGAKIFWMGGGERG